VREPTVADTIAILRGLAEKYSTFHGVRIADRALVAAAELSDRYITARFLPDKAIDLVDEACANARVVVESMPEELDNAARAQYRLQVEEAALAKEKVRERGGEGMIYNAAGFKGASPLSPFPPPSRPLPTRPPSPSLPPLSLSRTPPPSPACRRCARSCPTCATGSRRSRRNMRRRRSASTPPSASPKSATPS
jgi:ATP-dependent Clp protease ATP-binding subunit ClpA